MADKPTVPDDSKPSERSPGEDELGFDPESPDLADPQVDPVGPAIVPGDLQEKDRKKDDRKDYDPLADLHQ